MTIYYTEIKTNKNGQVIGYSPVIEDKKAKEIPLGTVKISLNGIKFKDYKSNPKNYYLSGNKLMEIKNENI